MWYSLGRGIGVEGFCGEGSGGRDVVGEGLIEKRRDGSTGDGDLRSSRGSLLWRAVAQVGRCSVRGPARGHDGYRRHSTLCSSRQRVWLP